MPILEKNLVIRHCFLIRLWTIVMLAVHPNDYGCIVMDLSARVEDPKK